MSGQQFDVFLAHNSKDKPLIREIYRLLKERGINPWLDEEEIAPGASFQDEIQQAIGLVKTAAIFIGSDDLGRWQAHELKTLISQCVERNIKVIPVLLPGVEEIPDRLLFLREFHAVSFRHSHTDEDGIFRLEWGITGQKPQAPLKADLSLNPNPLRQQEAQRQQEQQQREQVEAERKRQEAEAQRRQEEAEQQRQAELERQQQPSEPTINQQPSQETPPIPPQAEQDELSSEWFGANYYAKLRDLLAAQDWKAADQETSQRMFEVMGQQRDRSLNYETFKNFPCLDLRNIDRLWVKYSQGWFGFSVQKEIWKSCGSPPVTQCAPRMYKESDWEKENRLKENKKFDEFGLLIGWKTRAYAFLGFVQSIEGRNYSKHIFDLTAPKGHLPVLIYADLGCAADGVRDGDTILGEDKRQVLWSWHRFCGFVGFCHLRTDL